MYQTSWLKLKQISIVESPRLRHPRVLLMVLNSRCRITSFDEHLYATLSSIVTGDLAKCEERLLAMDDSVVRGISQKCLQRFKDDCTFEFSEFSLLHLFQYQLGERCDYAVNHGKRYQTSGQRYFRGA